MLQSTQKGVGSLFSTLASMILLSLATGGCSGGDVTGDSSGEDLPGMKIDAIYQKFSEYHIPQEYAGKQFNAYDKMSIWTPSTPIEVVEYIYRQSGIKADFAEPLPLEDDFDSVHSYRFYDIWDLCYWNRTDPQNRRATHPYFLYSMNVHGYEDGKSWDERAGRAPHLTCNCGTARNFTNTYPEFSMVYYDNIDSMVDATWREGTIRGDTRMEDYCDRIWGIVMAHELGHIYACLKEFADTSYHDPGAPCIMRRLHMDDTTWYGAILDALISCDSCRQFIYQVGNP